MVPSMKILERDREELHELLRKLRVNAGLTQAEVADRLKEPQSFVSKYESGERRLDLLELREVARALDVSLSELIGRFEKELQ